MSEHAPAGPLLGCQAPRLKDARGVWWYARCTCQELTYPGLDDIKTWIDHHGDSEPSVCPISVELFYRLLTGRR